MRIVTRPDLDGIVCAVLLRDALKIDCPIVWTEPSPIQKGLFAVLEGDILANLPYDPRASMWFDHHFSNRIDTPFTGAFEMAPSAAGVIYRHFAGRFSRNFDELVRETDVIDSATLSADQILNPQNYPYVLLSMTLTREHHTCECYWERLVDMLLHREIDDILADDEVSHLCSAFVEKNRQYRDHLLAHTRVEGAVTITDFRSFDHAPYGNRFLVFSLFPETVSNLKISHSHQHPGYLSLSVGASIVNRACNVNIGTMLAGFEGGGHPGAGGAAFDAEKAEHYLPQIIAILKANQVPDA